MTQARPFLGTGGTARYETDLSRPLGVHTDRLQ